MDADEGRDDWAEKERHALQTALTLFHTAAKKKRLRHEIRSTTHGIMEEAFHLCEKLIYCILSQEAIRLEEFNFTTRILREVFPLRIH